MRSKTKLATLLACVAIIISAAAAQANFLAGIDPRCNYRTLSDPGCVVCETVNNFTRDFPMGKGNAPAINGISIQRQFPFPGEYVSVKVESTTDGGATDQLPTSAQRIMAVEVSVSMQDGKSWYTNNWDGTKIGAGFPADYFTHEVLVVKNQGSIKYKNYESIVKPWAVSPESTAFNMDSDTPAPNRRCPADPALCNASFYDIVDSEGKDKPFDDPCPWGLACPLYDTFPPNRGDDGGFAAWPSPSCSQPDGDCNVPGFPEGGGDILDYFPSLDPLPGDSFPGVPGQPLVRVNGVPAIDCTIYNGVSRTMHPMCDTLADPVKDVYEQFGIQAYTVAPGQGKVVFKKSLDALDVVDATFYTLDMSVWTTKLDMNEMPFSTQNDYTGSFVLHAKVYDTCGNMASGAQSPPYPPFPGESNEAYIGVYDFYYDQRPIDTDPMASIKDDDPGTQCGATDTWCPEDPKTREEMLASGQCFDAGCECCYNECSPASCTYDGVLAPDVSAMCSNVGDSSNPPGCGPEFGSNKQMAELREFKMSHSASNLYIKMAAQGDMIWGCYGSWYPFVGCEYSLGELGSKFNGYSAQMINSTEQSTFYLIIIPDIPIYGSLSLFIDINKLLASAMGSTYQGMELEQYADGGGCKKPGEDEEPPGDPCEGLGDCDTPSADCDGDGFVNGTDSCKCEAGGEESTDGCPVEDPGGGDPLADYKCGACQVSVDGNKMYVEMGIEDTVHTVGTGAYNGMAMVLGIHNLDMDWLLYYACLNGYNLTALATDQTPRLSYYPFGNRGRTTVELAPDYIAPMAPSDAHTEACLGRCDESDRFDAADNDEDLPALEPRASKSVDEGYDPTSTQAEFSWQEVVMNNDSIRSSLTDLGGYHLQIARDSDGPFETLYYMCDPLVSADCYGLNLMCDEETSCTMDSECKGYDPVKSHVSCTGGTCCIGGDRDNPALDEPYPGRTRFPNPFDEDAPHNGYGFPGEVISCIIDTDCDPTHNNVDDDKDGLIDEGCWQPNCFDDAIPTNVTPDGQEYWLRVRSFDAPKEVASGTELISYSAFSQPKQVKILRNITPPATPDVVATYKMVEGGKAKIVWNPNKEHDIGGYVVYRCPANPIDAVLKTLDGTLEAWCADDANYRIAHQNVLDNLNGYFVDEGMGYYETGIYATSATPIGSTWATLTTMVGGFYIRDDKDNWDASDDLGYDGGSGNAGANNFGAGDNLPTPGDITNLSTYPGEPDAYEWINCTDLTLNSTINQDLAYCGNIEDPTSGWISSASSTLYNTAGVAQHLYDVTANPSYNENLHAPVLFYNGLVDGYTYYYKVKAVDSPYLGDGHNDISSSDNCPDGLTWYDYAGPTGCVNPIADRNCDDQVVRNDWTKGGNCSGLSPVMLVTPADTQAPQKPINLKASVQSSGESVSFTWEMSSTDRTVDHYNLYRAVDKERDFACVRGGCNTPPYADGCPCDPDKPAEDQCYQDPTGDWDRICDIPTKICTNPPFYSVEPQTSGCSTVPYNAGCVCSADSDCTGGLKCTYRVSICMIDQSNPPAGYSFVKDTMDNDGDGVIDEEFAMNGLDDDGDGLIDEDVGELVDTWKVGECPVPSYPYHDESNWASQERITAKTFTDHEISKDSTYYYRVAGVDNAVYDPNNGNPGDMDPPPPNQGIWSFSTIVSVPDVLAPALVTGDCSHPLSNYPMPCVEALDVATYESTCDEDISDSSDDNYGNQLSIVWHRSSVSDAQGYYVYRADDITGSGVEPSSGAFEKINQALIAQKQLGMATVTMCFKDTDIANGLDYYYAVTVVDSHGNESYLSEINGPVQAEDTTAPMTPVWGSTGGWESDDNGLKITLIWDEHEDYASTSIQLNDNSEIDFAHFNVYRSPDDDVCDPSELLCNNGVCTSDKDCSGDDKCNNFVCCTPGECCAGDLDESKFVDNDVEMNTSGSCDNMPTDVCYHYCITAVDDEGNESSVLQTPNPARAVDMVPPVAPTGLTTTAMNNRAVGLGWKQNKESDITCYVPYISTSANLAGAAVVLTGSETGYMTVTNQNSVVVKCIAGLNFVDTTTKSMGTTYYYRVSGVDSNGNEGAKSAYATVTPTLTDTMAPSTPEEMYIRAGFDMGELCAGCSTTNGIDDNSNGFIDEGLLKANYIELMWDRVRDADIKTYEIYRRSPAPTAGCSATCDVEADPTGDCDSDKVMNAVDDCPCTPTNPSTTQYGDYTLLTSKAASVVCPTSGVRPDKTLKENVCQLQDKGSSSNEICAGSRYWYSIVTIDEEGNTDSLDKATARAITPIAREDTTSPVKPAKPKIAVTKNGTKLVVKFYENDETDEDNMDLMGYIIYRDTVPTGSFTTQVAILNDVSKLNFCTQANQPPCYCDKVEPDYACFLDVSVTEGSRYFYKIGAFDYNGNESVLSDWAFGLPSPEAPIAAASLAASPRPKDPNALRVSWDSGVLLDDDNVAGFQLFRSTALDGNWTLIDPNPDTASVEYLRASSYLDTGLIGYSTYYYMLLTVSSKDEELVSPSLTTCGVPGEDIYQPGAPGGLSATPGDKRVTISWQQNSESDLGGYNVYRSTSRTYNTFTKINTSTVKTPSYTDSSGLSNGKTYYYCVTAYDNSPTFDTQGCYSDLDEESACSSIVTAMPNTMSSGVPRSITRSVVPGWNLIFAPAGRPSAARSVAFGIASDSPVPAADYVYGLGATGYKLVPLGKETMTADLLGEGFWYFAEDGVDNIVMTGLFEAESPYLIQLEKGWNLVGNPFSNTTTLREQFVSFSADGSTFVSPAEALNSGMVGSIQVYTPLAADPAKPYFNITATNEGYELQPSHGMYIWVSAPVTVKFQE